MVKKILVRLDDETIPQTILNEILSNRDLKHIEENVYSFEFNETVFFHATTLLNNNKGGLGYDLGDYLNSVDYFLKRMSPSTNQYLVIDTGERDFKRRASENFGVGLSSLFMVRSFNIKWQNITQIPQNQNLSKLRPDFIALDDNNRRFIFESKGTTQPNKISDFMSRAIQQAKSYSGEVISKFGFVSYFPNSTKIFPSFMFIADPLIYEEFPTIDEWYILMTHYIKVLNMSGFTRTLPIFTGIISQKYRLEKIQKESKWSSSYTRESKKFENLKKNLEFAFKEDIGKLDKYTFNDMNFIGNYLGKIKLKDYTITIFFGVEKNIIKNIISLNANTVFIQEDELIDKENKKMSIFSNGTILAVEII